jgi:aminoglycoside phosphotransferase (APT) family kinase protein
MSDNAARYRAAIAAAFPDLAIRSIRFLAEGWDSAAWEVNGELIFRFPKRADVATWLRYEIALLPLLGPTLPVSAPRFTHIAEPSHTFPYSFVGYRKLPGVPLADAPATLIRPERLAAQIGAFLTALHRFPVAHAVACGVPYASPEAWCAQYATMLTELQTLFPRMTLAERERTERLFADYLDNPPNAQFTPVLLHRDLGGDHLLLDPETGNLAGVIDWGDLSIGDPAQDFCGLPAAWLPILLSHYGGAVDAIFAERVAFYRALGPYHTLLFGLHTGGEPFIARGLAELRRSP